MDSTMVTILPVELSLARIAERGEGPDRIESAGIDFLERVRQAYLSRAKTFPDRYAVIDGDNDIENVASEVAAAVSRAFSL